MAICPGLAERGLYASGGMRGGARPFGSTRKSVVCCSPPRPSWWGSLTMRSGTKRVAHLLLTDAGWATFAELADPPSHFGPRPSANYPVRRRLLPKWDRKSGKLQRSYRANCAKSMRPPRVGGRIATLLTAICAPMKSPISPIDVILLSARWSNLSELLGDSACPRKRWLIGTRSPVKVKQYEASIPIQPEIGALASAVFYDAATASIISSPSESHLAAPILLNSGDVPELFHHCTIVSGSDV